MQWLIKDAEQKVARLSDGLSPENALERFASLLRLVQLLLAAIANFRAGSSSDNPNPNRLTIDG